MTEEALNPISEREISRAHKEERRYTLTLGVIAVLLLGVAIYMHFFAGDDSGYPTGPGVIYYTGPMKAKTGVGYGTIDGKPISEADAKAAAAQWLKDWKAQQKD